MRDVMKAGVSTKLKVSKCKKKKKISFQTFYPDAFNVTLSGNINKEAVEEQVINLNGNKFNIKFLSMVDKHTFKFEVVKVSSSQENKVVGLFKCDQCHYKTDQKFNLKRHNDSVHHEAFLCSGCKVSFVYRKSFLSHQMTCIDLVSLFIIFYRIFSHFWLFTYGDWWFNGRSSF